MVASELSFTECGPQRISCIWQFKHWFWHAPLRKILFLLWIPSLITLYQFRHTLIKFHRCANCPLPSVVTYSTLRDHLIASCKLWKNEQISPSFIILPHSYPPESHLHSLQTSLLLLLLFKSIPSAVLPLTTPVLAENFLLTSWNSSS